MDENEEFEFRARAEAEAAEPEPAPTPETPKPGILHNVAEIGKDVLGWVGKQMTRVPASIRGMAQAYQQGDPNQAANMAWQGLTNPESVQTSPEMMARFGADTALTKQEIKSPPPDAKTQWANLGNLPDPLKEKLLGFKMEPETTYTSTAQELGNAFDVLAPTGLEFLPPMFRGFAGRAGARAERAGTEAIQSSLKPSTALRNAPVPYESANFLTERPGAPNGGLGSALGKRHTLGNIQDFHERIGNAQDALLNRIPQVDLVQAIADAGQDVEHAIRNGGNHMLGISVRDADALRHELDQWIPAAQEVSPNGVTNGQNARNFRGSLAEEARYDHPDNTAPRRVVAATIRERLNEQLGQLSPEFRALDRQFAETIPLRNAVADALGREGNKYPIGLRTSMVIASHGASIPAELAKMALIEGTSRFGPQIALAKAGRMVQRGAEASQNLPIPAYIAGATARNFTQNTPPHLRSQAEDKAPENMAELADWIRKNGK